MALHSRMTRILRAAPLLFGLWLLCQPVCGYAQADKPEASAEDRATSFQAVTGAVKEDVPGGPLLVYAYGFVWLAVLGYALRLGRLQARVEQSLSRVESAVQQAQTQAPKP